LIFRYRLSALATAVAVVLLFVAVTIAVTVAYAAELSAASGTLNILGIDGIVKINHLAAGRTLNAEEIVVIILIVIAAVAVAIVFLKEIRLNVAKILIDLFDVVLKGINIVAEILKVICKLVHELNEFVYKLGLRLACVECKTLCKTLEISGLFGNSHFHHLRPRETGSNLSLRFILFPCTRRYGYRS